jgi:hypothetical protein
LNFCFHFAGLFQFKEGAFVAVAAVADTTSRAMSVACVPNAVNRSKRKVGGPHEMEDIQIHLGNDHIAMGDDGPALDVEPLATRLLNQFSRLISMIACDRQSS